MKPYIHVHAVQETAFMPYKTEAYSTDETHLNYTKLKISIQVGTKPRISIDLSGDICWHEDMVVTYGLNSSKQPVLNFRVTKCKITFGTISPRL